jgi:hypothetical protein
MSNKCWDHNLEADERGNVTALYGICNREAGHSGWHADGPLAWEPAPCPSCGVIGAATDYRTSPGFTGAALYWLTWSCCGYQELDAESDNLAAVR